jgi:hypothetical protein
VIYQDTLRFLKRKLKKPQKNTEWGSYENFEFLNYLQSRHSDDEIEKNSDDIKIAFREFFEPLGSILFRFTIQDGVVFKIVAYTVDAKDSAYLKKLIDIIKNNRRCIEYPYHNREDQIAISGKTRRSINAEIAETKERVNKKELIKLAIKEALGLSSRDIILIQKRKYLIKIFQVIPHLESESVELLSDDTHEKKLDSFDQQSLENHYEEFFLEVNIETFLDNVSMSLFEHELNFAYINNIYFEKNVLHLCKNAIADELSFCVTQNREYLLSLAGYIFRKNFEAIHRRFAVEIFELISKKNENAEKFLSYYTGKIYIEDNKKYAIPDLLDKDGKRWNATSMSAISSIWLRTKHKKDKLEVELKNLTKNFSTLFGKYESLQVLLTQYLSDIKKLSIEYNRLENEIIELEIKRKIDYKKEELLHSKHHKMLDIKRKLGEIKSKKDKIEFKLKKDSSKYNEQKNLLNNIKKEIYGLNQNLNVNSNSYNTVVDALTFTLMKRKKLVSEDDR